MEVDEPQITPGTIDALARRIDRPLVLVGMMGVGKSSVGRKLATLLHCPFIDADEEIERRVISRLIEQDRGMKVIATGGGAFCNEETRALILERTIAIWLDSDVDTLVERTARKDNRPLLKDGDPREILGRLRDERRPAYSQAPIQVMSTNGPHRRTVEDVFRGLEEWL